MKILLIVVLVAAVLAVVVAIAAAGIAFKMAGYIMEEFERWRDN